MKNCVSKLIVGGAFAVGLLSTARAQDEFEKVEVLDHPHYSLTKRISLGAEFTYLPLDAYYKPMLIEGTLSYQFTDFLSWEVGRFGYSLANYNTGLSANINQQLVSTGKRVAFDTVVGDLK